jgi:hypothetical protein
MEELRSEIRAAFEKEQAAHPPAAALRRNVVEAAAVQPGRKPNLQWLAIAAAAILGILAVAGLMSTRLAHRASVPAATPQAGPVKDYGPPPAGVPLLYLIDPRKNTWLQAYDWQGQPRGTIKFAQPLNVQYGSVYAAPDGSAFVYQPQQGGGIEYLDRLGRPLAPGLLPPAALDIGGMWADDSRHLCVVRFKSPSGEWRLFTKLPGEADHLVGIIPTDPNLVQTALSPVSCSFRNDQAILVRTSLASPPTPSSPLPPWRSATIALGLTSELWVVRISDGKILSDYTYSEAGSVEAVFASSDGVLIAENSSRSTAQPGAGAPSTVIRRVSDRSVVASLDPSVKVLAFSGDDSLVFVANGSGSMTPGPPMFLSVIDVRSGQVTWHGQAILMTLMAQPDGRDFAISSNVSFPTQTSGPLGTFLIIHGDGSVTRIPGSYTPA